MSPRALSTVLCLSLCLAFASRAGATVAYPEIFVQAQRPPGPIVAGGEIRIPLTVYVRNDLALDRVAIADRGDWLLPEVKASPLLARAALDIPGYRVTQHELVGRPDDGLSSIQILIRAGDFEIYETLDLGFAPGRDSTTEDVDDQLVPRIDASAFSTFEPARSTTSNDAPTALAKAPRMVRVFGRILTRDYSNPSTVNLIHTAEGVTIRLIQPGSFGDTELGSGIANINGDFEFFALVDGTPEVHVVARTENSVINVGGRGLFFETFETTYMGFENFSGTEISAGTKLFTGDMNRAVWLTTILTRANRWYFDRGYLLSKVNVRWPDDFKAVSWYTPSAGLEGLHITTDDVWRAGTILHEYGHFFVNSHAAQVSPPQYCNNLCDDDGTCGHCMWCEENEAIAWSEGFPNWLSYQVAKDISAEYGWGLPNTRDMERIGGCVDKGGAIERPVSTEGIFAAFLQDLTDTNADTDPAFDPTIREFSEIDPLHILEVATTFRASDTPNFIIDIRNFVHTSGSYTEADRRELWAAARINGFESDDIAPTTPTTIGSTTHPAGVMTPANVAWINVAGGTDLGSGVDRYLITITAGSPAYPDTSGTHVYAPVETGFAAWPDLLAEGTYWANAVAVDRAGNWSTTHISHGPMIVGPPGEIDLVEFTPGLWEGSIVARNTPDALPAAAGFPPELLGDTDVYFNLAFRNVSPSAAVVDTTFRVWVFIEGRTLVAHDITESVILANEEYTIVNLGPVYVPGGRHTIEMCIDCGGSIDESDDSNNVSGLQMVFRPSPAVAGSWILRDETYIDGASRSASTPFPTGVAERIVPTNNFAAALVRPNFEGANRVWLKASSESSGTFSGFETFYTTYTRAAQDAVGIIVNTGSLPETSIDMTIARTSGSSYGYEFRHVASQVLAPGDGVFVNWVASDLLGLYEFSFNVIETGPFTMEVEANFNPLDVPQELQLFWIDKNDPTVHLDPSAATAVTDSSGHARIDLDIPAAGTYCLAVFRDAPNGGGTFPMSFSLATTLTPRVDFEPFRDQAFWEAPFLPSPIPLDGIKTNFPDNLLGEGLNTYLNFAVLNNALVGAPAVTVDVLLDGQLFTPLDIGALGAGAAALHVGTTAFAVPGGRHTLVLSIDPGHQIDEADETNNMLGMQLGWTGLTLSEGPALSRAAPPDPNAGLDNIEVFTRADPTPSGEGEGFLSLNTVAPNSDGLRMPQLLAKRASGRWVGVAAMPGDQSDVDLRLHEVALPARAFDVALNESTDQGERTEFLVVNFNETTPREFDVGVINAGGGSAYDAQLAVSDGFGAPTDGATYGPFVVDASELFYLVDFDLAPGDYQLSLVAPPGSNLELSFHAPLSPNLDAYHAKSDADLDPQVGIFPGRAGPNEPLTFTLLDGDEGNFCAVVYKTDRSSFSSAENFDLKFNVALAPPAAIIIDGLVDQNYGPSLATQSVQTAFGDNDDPDPGRANGSELDGTYARVDAGVLYLMLSGNLESNFNDLEIFFDTRPGGQNRLRGDNPDVDDDGLNRMGDDGQGNGLRFDAGFEADYYFTVSGGDAPYRLLVWSAELLSGGGGMARFLGATLPQTSGRLAGPAVNNPHRVRVTIDNSNVLGVGAGTGPGNGSFVSTGVEFAIPLAALGDPTGCVRVCAFVNGRLHDFVSNQVLGPVPAGTDNLGEPRDVDFGTVDGNQYVIVCQGQVTAVPDGPSQVDRTRFALHPATPNPFNPRTTLSFDLPRAARVELAIYDLAGRLVRTLIDGVTMTAGGHEVVWDGSDRSGRRVGSGAYLVRMRAGGFDQSRRLVLIK